MALSADRNTPRAEGDIKVMPVAASQLIYGGALVARNASGYAVKGSAALNLIGAGRAEERVDNSTGSAGDRQIKVREGTFRFLNSAAADEITVADINRLCYVVDDQTVAKTSGNGTRSPAGLIKGVDAQGVWVLLDEAATRAASAAAAAGLGIPSFVIGAEAADAINLAIQLKDASGGDLAVRGSLLAYFSDDANGDGITATAFDSVAIGTDGLATALVAGKLFLLTSEADGDIDLAIGENAAVTKYLILVMPDGRLVSSGAITFA